MENDDFPPGMSEADIIPSKETEIFILREEKVSKKVTTLNPLVEVEAPVDEEKEYSIEKAAVFAFAIFSIKLDDIFLHDLVVHPDKQMKFGFGTLLLSTIIQIALKLNSTVSLEAPGYNQEYYEGFGFVPPLSTVEG